MYQIQNKIPNSHVYIIYFTNSGSQKRSDIITSHELVSISNYVTNWNREKTFIVRVYADDNYKLVEPITLTADKDYTLTKGTDTYGDYYGRGWSKTPDSNFIINGNSEPTEPIPPIPTTYNVTLNNNIKNAILTSDKGITDNVTTSDAILTLTAKENYVFSGAPQITINGINYNFTKGDNLYTFDLNSIDISNDVTAVINGGMYLKITFNLTNTNIYQYGIQNYTGNTNAIVGVTVPSGKKWNSGNVIVNYDDSTSKQISLTRQYDATHSITYYGTTLSFIDTSKNITSIIVTASADVVIGEDIELKYTLLNCSKTDDSPTTLKNNASSINKITINSTDGFIFKTSPTLRIVKNDGNSNIYNFILNTDNNIAELEITDTNLGDNFITSISVNAVAEASTVVKIRGFQNVYKMTKQQLNELAKARYITRTNDYYYQRIDLGKYIIALCEYPFAIPGDEDSYIVLGDTETDIIARRLNYYEFKFTSEKKIINGLYKNSSDISKSTIKIYLPYYGFSDIDSKYINTSIHIEILVNVLTNTCIYKIFSNDSLIETIETNIADKLPYITQITNNDISIGNNNVYVNMNENKLFVIIEQYPKVEKTYNNTLKVDLISNITGYVKGSFSQGLKISNAKIEELNNIKMLFNDGVYC